MGKELGIATARALGLWLLARFTTFLAKMILVLQSLFGHPMPGTNPWTTFASVSGISELAFMAILAIWVLRCPGKFVPSSTAALPLDRAKAYACFRVLILGIGLLITARVAQPLVESFDSIFSLVSVEGYGAAIGRYLDLFVGLLWAATFLGIAFIKRDSVAKALIGNQL